MGAEVRVFNLTRNVAAATGLVAALAFVLSVPASGAPKVRAPEPASQGQPAGPSTARSFTINEILARQATGRPNAAGKVAAVERGETATDAARTMGGVPGPEPFGMFAFKAPDGELWTKWRAIEQDLARDAKLIEDCRNDAKNCSPEAKRYVAILGELKARTGRAQLETANRLMNGAIRYVSDQQQHGVPDRWSAALASLAAGLGDCEDFAIAKYVALRDAGVAEKDMRMVLVRDTSIRIDHAVLAVRFEDEWLVLDNRKTFVVETASLKHYMPLFALDGEGVKLFAAPLANWGEGAPAFADWKLRGSDGGVPGLDPGINEWSLRGSDVKPAAASF
jgi:predicted transglutaminase-like cysteine proteinase